jgi:uncharacterized protein (DUF2147 family)
MAPLLLAALLLAQDAAPTLEGHWINAAGTVVMRLAPCPDAGWCGTVAWASDKAVADAARAGTSPLVGAELLHNFVPVGPGRWKGRIFVPDLKTRSKAEIRQGGPDRLVVRGCAVVGIVCKSQSWTRTSPRP